jgi:hypothetical protein
MRYYVLILIFLLGYSEWSFAQTFSFEILNDDTKTPISFAHIQVEKELIGTVTDINGRGSVTIPKDFVSKSVIISFIGYASLTISIQSLKAETTNKFFLKESSTDLDEIEVIDIGMDPRDFINSALEKVDETFYTKKYRSIGLYHEKVVEDVDSTFSYEAKFLIESQGFKKATNQNRYIENDEAYLEEVIYSRGEQKYNVVSVAELIGFSLPYGDQGIKEDSFISSFFLFKNSIEKIAFIQNREAFEGDWYFERLIDQDGKTLIKVSIGNKGKQYFGYWIDQKSMEINSIEGFIPFGDFNSNNPVSSYHPGNVRFRIDYFLVENKSFLKQIWIEREGSFENDDIKGEKLSAATLTIEDLTEEKPDKKKKVDVFFVQNFINQDQ